MRFTNNIIDTKIIKKKLPDESYLNKKTKALATKEEIKILITKTELKSEQGKIVKLQTYDSNLFIGQSHFNDDRAQLYLIFQPIYKTITTFSGLKDTNGNLKYCQMKNLCVHMQQSKCLSKTDMDE